MFSNMVLRPCVCFCKTGFNLQSFIDSKMLCQPGQGEMTRWSSLLLGPSRRFKRVVETIQAQLLSTHDQPSVQALAGKKHKHTHTDILHVLVLCLTFYPPDFTSDEKNGQLSRQPSTPSRQNSRRSESGSERERGEKERAADGGCGGSSSSSSGTVLQRQGSGKDKTRLLSTSNGTQSHPWKECCRRGPISLAFFSSFPRSFPHSFLPCFLSSCLAFCHYSRAMGFSRRKFFLGADLGI